MGHARYRSQGLIAGGCAALLLASLVMFGAGVPAQAQQAAPQKAAPSADNPLDINTASAEELTALPGIGPATAERIVAFREENGPFRRIEDLMKVRGIGEKSFEKLRSAIRVSKAR